MKLTKKQKLEEELGFIIDSMGLAMRDAYEPWVSEHHLPTPRMKACLRMFYSFCDENYKEVR